MNNIWTASDADFDQRVALGRVVVEFVAEWCGTCRAVRPAVERMASELAGRVRVVVVDVDEAPTVAARFGVRALPTFLVLEDGVVVGKFVGGAVSASEIDSLFVPSGAKEDV
ncbi:MAG: thiol reductase thioredoxin [Gemmatimonadetes bacterium]|nr:thiol reductase thioredoxin [Gemmatimonadota bacterium]